MPLFNGLQPAEMGLIGDGDGPLSLTVTDEGGARSASCLQAPSPALCTFTPAGTAGSP
jgi:hypothetical protein